MSTGEACLSALALGKAKRHLLELFNQREGRKEVLGV